MSYKILVYFPSGKVPLPNNSALLDIEELVPSGVASSRTNTVVTADYTVLNTDRNIIVNNPCIITLPTLATILHFENIDVINNSNGVVTVTSVEDINDFNTFDLYSQEVLTVQKSTSKYLVK